MAYFVGQRGPKGSSQDKGISLTSPIINLSSHSVATSCLHAIILCSAIHSMAYFRVQRGPKGSKSEKKMFTGPLSITFVKTVWRFSHIDDSQIKNYVKNDVFWYFLEIA